MDESLRQWSTRGRNYCGLLYAEKYCFNDTHETQISYHILSRSRFESRPVRRHVSMRLFYSLYGVFAAPYVNRCSLLHRNSGDTERRYHIRYYKTASCVHETDAKGELLLHVWYVMLRVVVMQGCSQASFDGVVSDLNARENLSMTEGHWTLCLGDGVMGDKVLGLEGAFSSVLSVGISALAFYFLLRSFGFSDGRWMKEVLL